MYNTTSENDNSNGYSDSKYVADILSSMANGRPVSNAYTTMPAYTCGIMTGTTPTLTPTTLANIEQTFIELQSVPVSTSSQDPLTQSGFVPPIVDPISNSSQGSSYDYDDDDSSSGSEWSVAPKRMRFTDNSSNASLTDSFGKAPTSRRGRRRHDLQLSPEEEGRRRVRRERNKLAAAKCRQRRVDHTNRLIDETDGLEDEKHSLEKEIQTLQQQKDQLEFILQTHKPLCKVRTLQNRSENHLASKVKMEPKSPSCSGPIDCTRPSSLPLVKRENNRATNGTGIPITTPSSGYFNFTGLDSIVDVSSGLTPITSRPSCGSQVCRNPSDGGSPTLISL